MARRPERAPRNRTTHRRLTRATTCLLYSPASPGANRCPSLLANPPPGFDDLTVDERIDYVGALWDRIAADPESVPVPEWHREILEERLASATADGDETLDWADVREELVKEFRRPTSDR